MKECKKHRENLVAFLYGELQKEDRVLLDSHLNACRQCRNELDELKQVIKGADSLNADIEKTMASVEWENLPAQISSRINGENLSPSRRHWLKGFWESLFQPRLKPVYAGLLLGVLLGSLVTLLVIRTPLFKAEEEGRLLISQDSLERVELEMARRVTLDYLRKSQYLLLDFIQFPPERSAEFWKSDLALQTAKDLLSKKKYINQQLDKFQMAKAKAICDQIEFLFFELAQISHQLSIEELKRIQNLIKERQILLKINLLKKDLEKNEI